MASLDDTSTCIAQHARKHLDVRLELSGPEILFADSHDGGMLALASVGLGHHTASRIDSCLATSVARSCRVVRTRASAGRRADARRDRPLPLLPAAGTCCYRSRSNPRGPVFAQSVAHLFAGKDAHYAANGANSRCCGAIAVSNDGARHRCVCDRSLLS